jgi:hypothetical protein
MDGGTAGVQMGRQDQSVIDTAELQYVLELGKAPLNFYFDGFLHIVLLTSVRDSILNCIN